MSKKEKPLEEENLNTLEEQETEEETVIISDTETLVDEATKKINEYKDIAQRLQAEFDNYRKRNNDSIKIARNDGMNDVILGIFPILDNFERGIGAVTDESAKNGMELIYKQLLNLLAKFDVEEIVALGEEFNPQFHHAIAQIDDAENANKVVEVYQKGYIRKDRVLRASMVKVAQ